MPATVIEEALRYFNLPEPTNQLHIQQNMYLEQNGLPWKDKCLVPTPLNIQKDHLETMISTQLDGDPSLIQMLQLFIVAFLQVCDSS